MVKVWSVLHASANPVPFPRSPTLAREWGGSLPVPATPLLGRERDVARVIGLIDRGDLRLVTLLGTGGVGKTRLALEVAHRIGGDFADGAVFVALEAIREAALVPGAVAHALDIPEQPGRDTADLVADVLSSQHRLLVLDNCEQVVEAAPFIADLLMRCPRLRVLATSRTPLTIGGEQRVRIAPLPVPEPGEARTAAVDLFIERGLAVNLGLALDEPALTAIASICRRLDGLPLAIELAAARVAALTPQQLLTRLTHRLTVLTGGRADAPARLRSMRDAIGWSYDLLAPEAQHLLRRTSVFLGGFPLDAAAFMVVWPDPPNEAAAMALVQTLIDQNLAQSLPDAAEPRFRMLETIREFGLQEAERLGETDDVHRAHAEYMLDLALGAERPLLGPDQARWLERLEADYPDLLAAFDWLAGHGRLDDAAEMASAIHWFLLIRAHLRDVIERLEGWSDRPDLTPRGRAQLLYVLGTLKAYTESDGSPVAMLREAVDVFKESGEVWQEALVRTSLTLTHTMHMDVPDIPDAAMTSLQVAGAAGYHRGACLSLASLAIVASDSGDENRAWSLRDKALQTAVRHGDIWFQANALRGRAWLAAAAGQLEDAEEMAARSMHLTDALGARRDLVLSLDQLSRLALVRGDLNVAALHNEQATALAKASGYGRYARGLLVPAGMIQVARGEFPSAREILVTLLQDLDDVQQEPIDAAECLDVFALLAAQVGEESQAIRFYAASRQLWRQAGIDFLKALKQVDSVWLARELQVAIGKQALDRADRVSESIAVDAVIAEARSYRLPVTSPQAVPPVRPFGLSRRERDVLQLMAAGHTNQQIADELFLAHRTITSHVTHILAKLEVPSRTAAVSLALRAGLA